MKKIILVLMMFSLSAHSAIITFQETLQLKKKNVTSTSTSKVIAKLGQEFLLPLEGTEGLVLKMTVSKSTMEINSLSALVFKGVIFQQKDGKEIIISSPKIITKMGIEAKITIDDLNGTIIDLTILPKKLTE